jgi:membrane protease YdiL (CAAX protease family)
VAPAGPPPPPPPSGERPEAFPRWPLWAPFAAIGIGAAAGLLILGVLAAALEAGGVDLEADSPGFTAAGTFVLDVSVVAAAIGIAATVARPALWQFGLRRGPLGYSIGMAVIAVLAFFIFEIAYVSILNPENPQTIAEDLGADRNTLLLVAGALVVIVVAPVCEELFFRGFLYRVLRMRMAFWAAALIDGVLFGFVHGSLVIVPVLAFLGIALCWVYERTGTLFAPIAIHALNNMIAYGAITDDGWGAALGVGAAMLVACAVVPGALPRRTPAPI